MPDVFSSRLFSGTRPGTAQTSGIRLAVTANYLPANCSASCVPARVVHSPSVPPGTLAFRVYSLPMRLHTGTPQFSRRRGVTSRYSYASGARDRDAAAAKPGRRRPRVRLIKDSLLCPLDSHCALRNAASWQWNGRTTNTLRDGSPGKRPARERRRE